MQLLGTENQQSHATSSVKGKSRSKSTKNHLTLNLTVDDKSPDTTIRHDVNILLFVQRKMMINTHFFA